MAIDPFDHNTVYYGCQVIFRTSNAGMSWSMISPDLSTQDPSRIVSSGGIVGDNLGQFYGEVVFSIAPSDVQKGLIWAGTNDGKVWYTKDGGGHWNDVTKNVTGMPRVGRYFENPAVAFRCRNRLHCGGSASDGQPRSVHFQDHRFRPDLDQAQRRPTQRAAGLRARDHRESQSQGHAVRRHGKRTLLFHG